MSAIFCYSWIVRKFIVFFTVLALFSLSLYSVGTTSSFAFFTGFDGTRDMHVNETIPLRSSLCTELVLEPISMTSRKFSIGPYFSFESTTETFSWNNTKLLGHSGASAGISTGIKLSDTVSIKVQAGAGTGLYDGGRLAYASLDGFASPEIHLDDLFIAMRLGVSYRKDTLSAIMQIGGGIQLGGDR